MAKIDKQQALAALHKVQEEVSLAMATFREKGAERFGRTIALGVIALVISYYGIYLPPQKKMRGLQREIDLAKSTAQYADQYKDLRDRLLAAFTLLPQASAIEQRWLETVVMETMQKEEIMSDSMAPPDDMKAGDFTTQRQVISTQLKFAELMSWLSRIESTKPMLHVNLLSLAKRETAAGQAPGLNTVSCEIGTVIPMRRPGQP